MTGSRGLSPHSALSPFPLETGTCTLDSVVECCNLLAYTHILTITIFHVKIWYTGHSPLQNDRRSRTGICVNSDADTHSGRRACSARNLCPSGWGKRSSQNPTIMASCRDEYCGTSLTIPSDPSPVEPSVPACSMTFCRVHGTRRFLP